MPQLFIRYSSFFLAALLVLTLVSVARADNKSGLLLNLVSPNTKEVFHFEPVLFKVEFNGAVDPTTFSARLNGRDVTKSFVVTATGAEARLRGADGLRVSKRSGNDDESEKDDSARGRELVKNKIEVSVRGGSKSEKSKIERKFFFDPTPPQASAVIPAQGGRVVLPGFGAVSFPAGAFTTPQQVTLSATNSPDTAHDFEQTAFMFDAANRLPYELRVNTGTVQPATDFQVTFEVPAPFRATVPADSEVRILGQNLWQSAHETLDTFELYGPRFTAADTVITASLPALLFTDGRTADRSFEAIVLLATTPTKPNAVTAPLNMHAHTAAELPLPVPYDAYMETSPGRVSALAAAAGTCQGSTLSPPLDGNIQSNSPFGPRDPNIGASPFHYGTDYPVPDGTPVKAMADGVIERVSTQTNRTGQPTGWGQYVVIRHADGSKTLSAHLQSVSVPQGTSIRAGDVVALSDSTGGVTGPHLHIEYAPNGRIYDRNSKVDPEPCIDRNVTGSITVRDNGFLADDAFSVAINGLVVCQTAIGASNTCGVGNLRPGTATLTLTALIAPDDVGTYEISLADGLMFGDGSTIRSGTIPQGRSASFAITIPAFSPAP